MPMSINKKDWEFIDHCNKITVFVGMNDCDVCNIKIVKCLTIENQGGDCGIISICQKCINKYFDNIKSL